MKYSNFFFESKLHHLNTCTDRQTSDALEDVVETVIDHSNCSGPPNQISHLQILSDLDNLQMIPISLKREMGQ